jgi:hypothetical protein
VAAADLMRFYVLYAISMRLLSLFCLKTRMDIAYTFKKPSKLFMRRVFASVCRPGLRAAVAGIEAASRAIHKHFQAKVETSAKLVIRAKAGISGSLSD